MKKFINTIGTIGACAFIAYGAYLVYDRFFLNKDSDETGEEDDDLFDEEVKNVTFAERVKSAAERQLDKVK